MGYRHLMISDTMVKRLTLPEWFTEKYEGIIDFSEDYWRTYHEYKRYGLLSDIEEDVQRLLRENGSWRTVQLVFFADEGMSISGIPDISVVVITSDSIKEYQGVQKP